MTQNKFEGALDRKFTTYNPQVVLDDVFLLGIDGTVKRTEWRWIALECRG